MGYYQIPELFYLKQVLGLEITVNKYLHTKNIGYTEKKSLHFMMRKLDRMFKNEKTF